MDVSVGVREGDAVMLGVLVASGVPVSVTVAVAVSVAVSVAVADPAGVIVTEGVELASNVAVGVPWVPSGVGVAVAQKSPGSTMGSKDSLPGPG